MSDLANIELIGVSDEEAYDEGLTTPDYFECPYCGHAMDLKVSVYNKLAGDENDTPSGKEKCVMCEKWFRWCGVKELTIWFTTYKESK